MAKHRKKGGAASKSPKSSTPSQVAPEASRLAGRRLLVFRLLAVIAVPVLFLCLLELGLRLAGFGHQTEFLLPSSQNGQNMFVQNNQFGWRFFGPKLARLPWPLSIPQQKSPNTVRIFVFGESAAKGEPQPAFGLPRMLEAMLTLRYPGVHFEVVNAAMTAINSHAILPIARDCAKADGDIWVIYMGNNEVVGPFGAGTVFGSQVPPLPLIRGLLALKATRTGQLLDSARGWFQKPQWGSDEWGGMKMFLDQQVPAGDPRMSAVYDHFERNLADIVRAGQRAGAGVVVSTVAVNLKDSAPFGSAHRTGLSDTDKAKWDQFYQPGIKAWNDGNEPEAAKQFQAAAQIDDQFADLRFRQGECALALGRPQEAQKHFQAARDLDTLRFRCDTRLNDLIRQGVSEHAGGQALLADTEKVFSERSPDGLPGNNLFYEHVHLNFDGNYLLARTIAEQIEKLLPAWVTKNSASNQQWPTAAECAKRLGWSDLDHLEVLNDIHSRISVAPFTGQLNHDTQMQRLQESIMSLAPATRPAALKETQKVYEAELALFPDDPALNARLASLKSRNGDLAGATASLRRELELLPNDPAHWFQLGVLLAQQQKYEDAVAAFQRARDLDPEDLMSVNNLAQSLWMLGRREEAVREFRRMTVLKPESGLAWLNLGQSLENMGKKAAAEDCFQKALTGHSGSKAELVALAQFCQNRGWHDAAATNYNAAIQLDPADSNLRLQAGQNFLVQGHYAEAVAQLAEAVRLAPESAEAHYFHGLAEGQQNNTSEAEREFREALRLQPDLLETRVNLGVALMKEGHSAEALEQFEMVLQQCPTNQQALEFRRTLRSQPGSPPDH